MRFLKKNKKGIELTVNFLVMLILGIAMLSGAFIMTKQLFSKAEKYKEQVDANTQNEIRKLITDTNDLVIIYPARQVIARKKTGVFGVGVNNVLDSQGSADEFKIGVMFSKAYQKDKRELPNCNPITGTVSCNKPNDWPVYLDAQEIKKNELRIFTVSVEVPKGAPAGVYVYDVRVCDSVSSNCDSTSTDPPNDAKLYDGIVHKIYVSVE